MAQDANVHVVQQLYAAFGRGDIPAVLAHVAPDVAWEAVYGADDGVPHGGSRRGREAVATFFEQLGQHVEFETFEPRDYVHTGDDVVVLGSLKARVRRNGRPYEGDWAMHFRLQDGKVTRFREYTNSAGVNAAFR